MQHLLDSTELETESMLGSADKNTWFDVSDQGSYINKDSSSITLGIMILLAISRHAKEGRKDICVLRQSLNTYHSNGKSPGHLGLAGMP